MDKNAPTIDGSGDLWSSPRQVPDGARIVVLCRKNLGLSTLKGVEEEEGCIPLGLQPYACPTLA
jgi:hypothetical protein